MLVRILVVCYGFNYKKKVEAYSCVEICHHENVELELKNIPL